MNLLPILIIYQPLLPNLHGNHLKFLLIWQFFLSQIESDVLKTIKKHLSREEWNGVKPLANNRDVVIKRADKWPCVVIWNRNDYVKEAECNLTIKIFERVLSLRTKYWLWKNEESNQCFKSLNASGIIWKKSLSTTKQVVSIKRTFFLEFIKVYLMFQGSYWSQTV